MQTSLQRDRITNQYLTLKDKDRYLLHHKSQQVHSLVKINSGQTATFSWEHRGNVQRQSQSSPHPGGGGFLFVRDKGDYFVRSRSRNRATQGRYSATEIGVTWSQGNMNEMQQPNPNNRTLIIIG